MNILCFWDSHTRGQIPDSQDRYWKDIRRWWLLQDILWDEYNVIEEWLPWRTTCYDHPNKPWRNWEKYFDVNILSKISFDILVLFLWTNDLKKRYNARAEDIVSHIEQCYIKKIIGCHKDNDLANILVSPPYITFDMEKTSEKFADKKAFDQLADSYKELADKHWYWYIDLRNIITPDRDWVHFWQESHSMLAQLLSIKILSHK